MVGSPGRCAEAVRILANNGSALSFLQLGHRPVVDFLRAGFEKALLREAHWCRKFLTRLHAVKQVEGTLSAVHVLRGSLLAAAVGGGRSKPTNGRVRKGGGVGGGARTASERQ